MSTQKYINSLLTVAALREKYLGQFIKVNGLTLRVVDVGTFGTQHHLGFVLDDRSVAGWINGWVHYQLAGEPVPHPVLALYDALLRDVLLAQTHRERICDADYDNLRNMSATLRAAGVKHDVL